MWTVTKIFDGDTFQVEDPHQRKMIVRLWGMDAPEHGQLGFRGARAMLKILLARTPLSLSRVDADRYGRTVCKVRNGAREDVSLEMIRSGWAWWYKQYAARELYLAAAERDARRKLAGIWRESNPIAPWAFRHRTKRAGVTRSKF
jgi:micrococcal nuclease